MIAYHARQISHNMAFGEIHFSRDDVVTEMPHVNFDLWRHIGMPNLGPKDGSTVRIEGGRGSQAARI